MQYDYKIVRFDIYCNMCKYKNLNEGKDPCNECLNNPANLHSRKPVKFDQLVFKKRRGLTFKQLKRYTFDKVRKYTFGKICGKN